MMKFKSITIGLLADSSLFAATEYKTQCKATLTGTIGTLTIPMIASKPYRIDGLAILDHGVKIDMGKYLIVAEVRTAGEDSAHMEPTFWMSLNDGNPIQGKVNEMTARGLDLEN